ncbi:hypothetical protein BJV77DRAFT_403149 [Russula vinacea]|nr:hypothetical protein BJV77DRAFT_403149 [Russula vinacea]
MTCFFHLHIIDLRIHTLSPGGIPRSNRPCSKREKRNVTLIIQQMTPRALRVGGPTINH